MVQSLDLLLIYIMKKIVLAFIVGILVAGGVFWAMVYFGINLSDFIPGFSQEGPSKIEIAENLPKRTIPPLTGFDGVPFSNPANARSN